MLSYTTTGQLKGVPVHSKTIIMMVLRDRCQGSPRTAESKQEEADIDTSERTGGLSHGRQAPCFKESVVRNMIAEPHDLASHGHSSRIGHEGEVQVVFSFPFGTG